MNTLTQDFTLRDVKMPKQWKIKIPGVDGRIVKIRCHPLNGGQMSKIVAALQWAHSNLQEPNDLGLTKESLVFAAKLAGFVGTRSEGVGAFTSDDPRLPIVVLNDRSDIWNDPKELAVTLLHELLHLLHVVSGKERSPEEKHPQSYLEAVHDILCYKALGFHSIRADHWAFQQYPELLKEKERFSLVHCEKHSDIFRTRQKKQRELQQLVQNTILAIRCSSRHLASMYEHTILPIKCSYRRLATGNAT